MFSQYFSLAFKNLRHRGLRSWLTILGIFIGIAAVVSLISLGQGLEKAVTGQFGSLDVDKLVIQNTGTGFGPPGSTAPVKLTDHDMKIIESVSGVKMVVPRLIRMVKIEYNKAAEFRYVGSLPADAEQIDLIKESLKVDVSQGKFLTKDDKGKVIIGSDIANSKSFDKEIRVGSTITIQGKKFQVAGILGKSATVLTNSIIIMMEDDIKSILNIGNEIDLIVVQLQSKDVATQVAKSIEEKLRKDRKEKPGEEDFSVQTPSQALSAVNTILNIVNIIIISIAGISILIGSIGITNAMYTSVLERTKEIGVMKAIGAKNSDILFIFMIESGLLGLVGGILGALFGLALAFIAATGANSFFGQALFEVSPSYPLLAAAISFSFVIGIAAGILPARQASKLKPVDALRK
jgi:putative ABC transport system permease protein